MTFPQKTDSDKMLVFYVYGGPPNILNCEHLITIMCSFWFC